MLCIYNDWLKHFCSHYLNRQISLACLPYGGVELAVQEIRRVAKLGLKGLELSCSSPGCRRKWCTRSLARTPPNSTGWSTDARPPAVGRRRLTPHICDTLACDDKRRREGKTMSEPISPERFAVLVERTGLKLTPNNSRNCARAIALSSEWSAPSGDRAAEPAHIFVHPKL